MFPARHTCARSASAVEFIDVQVVNRRERRLSGHEDRALRWIAERWSYDHFEHGHLISHLVRFVQRQAPKTLSSIKIAELKKLFLLAGRLCLVPLLFRYTARTRASAQEWEIVMVEHCAICGCELHRTCGTYALPTCQGRSHATRHHYVAERFFGRSGTRKGTKTDGIFSACPWGHEGESSVFCYECHEELLHNPVLLPEDIARFSALVRKRGLAELSKSGDRTKSAARVMLLHEVVARGLAALEEESERGA